MYWKRSVFRHFLLGLFFLFLQTATPLAKEKNNFPGGDFTLQSYNGEVTLSHLQGRVVLLFFGYTSCPNICPVSLNTIAHTFNMMHPTELKQLQAIFISLDPGRDTLELLKDYVGYFHPQIIGATDKVKHVKQITAQYGVKWTRKELSNSALGYSIAHSSDIYLLDKKGKFSQTIPHDVDPKILYAKLQNLMTGDIIAD